MASSGEQRGFVFSVVFILIFSTMIATMPTALQGLGDTATSLLPIDPNLVSDFATTAEYDGSDFAPYTHSYSLGNYKWIASTDNITKVLLSRKILWGGLIWFGAVEHCEFVLSNGTNRGSVLYFDNITADATDGAVRYELQFTTSGNDAGSFIAYWNTTLYSDAADAWDEYELYLLHGMGIDNSSATNVFTLLLGLLFFQLPNVPALINVFLASPIWACIIYLIWFVIKESLPFV